MANVSRKRLDECPFEVICSIAIVQGILLVEHNHAVKDNDPLFVRSKWYDSRWFGDAKCLGRNGIDPIFQEHSDQNQKSFGASVLRYCL